MVDSAFEEQVIDEITAGLSVVACVADWKPTVPIAYASTPITTGRRMYNLFEQRGITSRDQLPSGSFEQDVMRPNIASGDSFGKQLRATEHYKLVICPATFFAKDWGQEHYMALWERVIATFATAVHFNDGWEYSTGCVEELVIALGSGKEIYEGITKTPLEQRVGVQRIEAALEHI